VNGSGPLGTPDETARRAPPPPEVVPRVPLAPVPPDAWVDG
jgi:hypothetical protein